MPRVLLLIVVIPVIFTPLVGQSGRSTGYSESRPARIVGRATPSPEDRPAGSSDGEVVRVATDLVTIPVRISSENGKPVPNIRPTEFRVYENGVQQQIAYFSNEEQPFTVVLALDMSYSSVFKLEDIQLAARIFVSKLREHDRVMVVSFDERPHILCEPTNDRRILRMAIDGAKIGSGTSLYDTLEMVTRKRLSGITGRRAIVLLSDGVDTSSVLATSKSIERYFAEEDVLVYPIQYDTYEDVKKNRKKDAEIRFDDNDRPYVVQTPPGKGERQKDYESARNFLRLIADDTGGRVHRVTSTTNLNDAFGNIADELRRVYSLGYYPSEDRKPGAIYDIKVRVYRPDLKVTARNQYIGR